MLINTPISLGELVDKISILMIKQRNINDQSKLIHVISSYALMLAGVIGLLGGILFYDEALIQAYYYSFVITSVAIGIELIRTGKD